MTQDDTTNDSLLAKFLAGEATPEEAMLVADWAEKSAENKQIFDASLEVSALASGVSLAPPDKALAWNAIAETMPVVRKPRIVFFTPLRLAAAIPLLIALGAAIYLSTQKPKVEEPWVTKNSRSEISNLSLEEGTTVVLNRNSALSYPKEFTATTRTVRLSGEGFFDVTHKPDRPFVIECEDVSVKVLGTAFNVSDLKSTVEATVTRGKVMMYNKSGSVIINPGWTGVYDREQKKLSLRKSEGENNLGYATHTFAFENASLKQVTDDLSAAFGVTFVFEKDKVKDCRFTSAYRNKPLPFILNVVAESLGLTYTLDGNVVHISGDGCL